MSFVDSILIALVVNLAATVTFFSLQGPLERLKKQKPRLAQSLGLLLVAVAVGIFVLSRMFSGVHLDLEQKTVAIPLMKIIGKDTIHLKPSMTIARALTIPWVVLIVAVASSIAPSYLSTSIELDDPFPVVGMLRSVEAARVVGMSTAAGIALEVFKISVVPSDEMTLSIGATLTVLFPFLLMLVIVYETPFRERGNPIFKARRTRGRQWTLLALTSFSLFLLTLIAWL